MLNSEPKSPPKLPIDLSSSLLDVLVDSAHRTGFPIAGAVDIDLALADPNHLFQKHSEYYSQWIQQGYAGEMQYLVRGQERRMDPRNVFPKAQSVFCVALPYSTLPAGAASSDQGPRYARYLRGPDYHIEMKDRLEQMMIEVKNRHPDFATLEWKVCVDTSAILERTWAALAGLGWIGKNTLLIHPKYGSYLLLGEVLINQKTGQGPTPLPNFCGNCTRCLNACPTKALKNPYELNSTRCISYWTLEKRGELTLDEEDRKRIGTWVAGCDICQEVCPFNLKRTKEEIALHSKTEIDAIHLNSWPELLTETEDAYKSRVKNSALNRVKPEQFKRNLRIAVENASNKDIR